MTTKETDENVTLMALEVTLKQLSDLYIQYVQEKKKMGEKYTVLTKSLIQESEKKPSKQRENGVDKEVIDQVLNMMTIISRRVDSNRESASEIDDFMKFPKKALKKNKLICWKDFCRCLDICVVHKYYPPNSGKKQEKTEYRRQHI